MSSVTWVELPAWQEAAARRRSSLTAVGTFLRRQPAGAIAVALLVLLVAVALLAPWIAPYPVDYIARKPAILTGPSSRHFFRTDQYGRDIFSRLLFGARVSLYVGFFGAVVATVVATVLGVAAGIVRGWFDAVLVRVIDVFQAIPSIVLLVAILSITGGGMTKIMLILGLSGSIAASRIFRGAALSLAQEPYIEAATVIGCRKGRIIFRHVLPNVVPLMLVLCSVGAGAFILAEAGLSFLGYGIQAPATSWGAMMARDSAPYMASAPALLLAPSVALCLTVLAINLLGDALSEHLDPRLRRSR